FLVRRPPALEGGSAATAAGGEDSVMSVGQALKSPQFIILLLTNFFCCATHSGPIIHTVNYAVSCGIPLIAAVSIYSLEGFAGMGLGAFLIAMTFRPFPKEQKEQGGAPIARCDTASKQQLIGALTPSAGGAGAAIRT